MSGRSSSSHDSEDEYRLPPRYLEFGEWCAEMSEDLMDLWEILKERADNGGQGLLENGNYNDFCEFMYHFSNKYLLLFDKRNMAKDNWKSAVNKICAVNRFRF